MNQPSNNRPNVLITGSTSYVCKYLVNKLLSCTDFNIVITYRANKGNHEANNRLFFEKADLLDPSSFEGIFVRYKPIHVVHLAAMARVPDGENFPAKTIRANFVATVALSGMSVEHGAESMVFTSSNLAQDAVSVVGIGKLLVEQYFQKINSPTTKFISLRMPNVIDSNGAVTLIFKKQIENGRPITITHPDMSRMFVVGERAADFLNFLIKNGKNKGVYVSYEKPVNITDLAKDMIKKSGKDLKIVFIGMKPGEKLSEKSFTVDEVVKTDVSGLGMIRDYRYDKSIVKHSIDILNDKEGVRSDKGIQDIFAGL